MEIVESYGEDLIPLSENVADQVMDQIRISKEQEDSVFAAIRLEIEYKDEN